MYLQILSNVKSLVHEAIGRSNSNWRLMHACPACTYTLKDEDTLKFRLLYTMDGNDSLKRVLKKVVRDDSEYLNDDNDIPLPRSAELPSTQSVGGDRYLTRDYVNSFAGDSSVDMLSVDDKVRCLTFCLQPTNSSLGKSMRWTLEQHEGRKNQKNVGCV